jgi:hypothetical protein
MQSENERSLAFDERVFTPILSAVSRRISRRISRTKQKQNTGGKSRRLVGALFGRIELSAGRMGYEVQLGDTFASVTTEPHLTPFRPSEGLPDPGDSSYGRILGFPSPTRIRARNGGLDGWRLYGSIASGSLASLSCRVTWRCQDAVCEMFVAAPDTPMQYGVSKSFVQISCSASHRKPCHRCCRRDLRSLQAKVEKLRWS